MGASWEYYRIEKEISEIKDLLSEILRRLSKLEYNGQVEFSDPYNVGKSKKIVNVSLKRDNND